MDHLFTVEPRGIGGGLCVLWRTDSQRLNRGLATLGCKLDECQELVNREWQDKIRGSHAFRFCEKMKRLRQSLKAWYKGKGRNSKKLIEQLKEEI
ncbi:hypothetical protein ACFX16_047013 [Malus domestica]